MTTLLCIDAGNTRIKWQVRSEGRVCAEGRCATATPAIALPKSVVCAIDSWAISAVAGHRVVNRLQVELAEIGVSSGQLLSSQRRWNGLRNGYESPERLGVDRWLAMIAATKVGTLPIVVVDAGTATTVDPIDEHGLHLGGFIMLGLDSMLAGLGAATAGIDVHKVRAIPRTQETRNTQEAVLGGAIEATKGLIEHAERMLIDRCGRRPVIVVTGGNGPVLCAGTPTYHWHRDLVLEGIEICAQACIAQRDGPGSSENSR